MQNVMVNEYGTGVLQLPYATHTRFLPQIMNISSATDQIYGRFLKMYKVMEPSPFPN